MKLLFLVGIIGTFWVRFVKSAALPLIGILLGVTAIAALIGFLSGGSVLSAVLWGAGLTAAAEAVITLGIVVSATRNMS